MTGSKHTNHCSARSPRATPEGPARDNPIAGSRTGTTQSEPSAPASAGASSRHKKPCSRPASTCRAHPPRNSGGASSWGEERDHGVRTADRSTESDWTGQGAPHQRRATRHARVARRRPQPRHKDRCQATPATGCRIPAERAQQQTTAQEQVPGDTQPTHRTPQARVAGYKPSAHTNTHTHPSSPAKSGRAQPKPEPKHTHPHRTLKPGVAEYKGSAHRITQTPQDPSHQGRDTAVISAQAHTPTPQTSARSGRVQADSAHKHTHTQTPQPGVAGHSRNLSPNTHSHSAQTSQECRGTSGARTRTQMHMHPIIPARIGRRQPELEPEHQDPHCTSQPGVEGYKQSAHTKTYTPQNPSQEWRGAAATRAQAHTPAPHAPTTSDRRPSGARTQQHTNPQKPQPGVAGCSRNPGPNTHTHTAHPCQEWRGTSGARKQTHTHPNTPARSGGEQPKPEPKHTHPHRTPQPEVAAREKSAHTNTHGPKTPQPGVAERSRNPSSNTHTLTAHPSQEWQGRSGAHTQTHTQTDIPARCSGAQTKPEPKHTHPHRTPQPEVAGWEQSAHTNTHGPKTPQPGVAERSRNPSSNTHTLTAHPSQEWQGRSGAHTQTHTQTDIPARCSGAQPKPEPKNT